MENIYTCIKGLCQPSVVLTVGSRRVGIVGYLTQETLEVSNPGKLVISDELEAVAKEAERLHNKALLYVFPENPYFRTRGY